MEQNRNPPSNTTGVFHASKLVFSVFGIVPNHRKPFQIHQKTGFEASKILDMLSA